MLIGLTLLKKWVGKMPNYEYTYVREQRAHLEVTANNEKEAEDIAQAWMIALKLESADDESDDPGELFYDGEYHVNDYYPNLYKSTE